MVSFMIVIVSVWKLLDQPTYIKIYLFFMLYIVINRQKQKPPTLYLLTLQFFIFGITTTSVQSLKIFHHFLVVTTVSLNRWKRYS